MNNPDLFNESYRATYCPESNKLHLYVGRVPRPEYDALRAEGWTSTPKQSENGGGEFAATWTPDRRDTCISYAGLIEDEDQSPQDRAADRAERFGGYRDKRTSEAVGRADTYDAGPQAHGYQSQARAERAAGRHDRVAGRAVDAWSKAEYWQHRTAGVISHALYSSRPDVRMGRIKEIESEIRKVEKRRNEYAACFDRWQHCASMTDIEKQNALAARLAYVEHGDYTHLRTGRKSHLYDFVNRFQDGPQQDPLTGAELCALWLSRHGPLAEEGDWLTHYRLRLAYENQMLEAQGGRAAFVEMEVGGFIAGRQIHKVNKSSATGRVVSVLVRDNHASTHNHFGNPYPDGITKVLSHTIETERMPADAYRAPTDEERAAFTADKKARKAAAPKVQTIPLVNPTDADAQRLQDVLNERAKADHCARHLKSYGRDYAEEFKSSTVCRLTQAQYSANSKGSYARAETRGICCNAEIEPRASNMWNSHEKAEEKRRGPKVCEVRTTGSDGSDYGARRVIILTDKPQKPLPATVWEAPATVTEPATATV